MVNGHNYKSIDLEKCKEGLEKWKSYKDDIKALERIVRRRK